MKDRIFIDTNILVYANLEDSRHSHKRERIIQFFDSLKNHEVYISVQVLNELYNVMLKNKIDDDIIQKKLKIISDTLSVCDITLSVIKRCWSVRKRYLYAYYDSLIIASAIEAGCGILYSEDMQDGQKICSLIIRNPLK